VANQIKSKRRYYLLKLLWARRQDNDQDGIWRSKQQAVSGTALPSDFPLLSRLAAADYTTTDDLDGADANELKGSGFTAREAETIFAALAPLL
jgi:hypothetical protein